MRVLTPEQRRRFDDQGFLVLEGAVDPGWCDRLRAHADELVAQFDPDEAISVFSTREQTRTSDDYFLTSGDKIRFFFEEEAFTPEGGLRQSKALSINKIGHAQHDLDPVFEQFSYQPLIRDLAADLDYRDPAILQSMYIFKQPSIGGEVTLHTDQTFLWTEPPSVTGFWVALEDATLENGCMWAVPGGHRLPPRERFRRDPDGGTSFEVFDAEPYPTEGEVPLEAAKGTMVLLHGLLPHRSGPNRSSRSRHAYTLHVVDRAARYADDNWLQRGRDLPLRPLLDLDA